MKSLIDQIDSELNFQVEPNLAYIRGKVEELKLEVSEEDSEARNVSRLENEIEELENQVDDIEEELKILRKDIQSVINCNLSNEDKLNKIKTLIED